MNEYIKNLIELKAVIAGRIKKENGFVVFERVDEKNLEQIPENELGFATTGMGRAIFTFGENNEIINYKGVDSHLLNEELITQSLVGGIAAYLPRANNSYKNSMYPINLVVFQGKRPDIRIRGASPLEDLEIEGHINSLMSGKGIKLPKINYIKEFSEEFSLKYGLPLKRDGSYEEFDSAYKDEDLERKKYLSKIYGEAYTEENTQGKRPETLGEYFRRLKITEAPEFLKFIEEVSRSQNKKFEIQDFINYVDEDYSLGQRYGQSERIIESPFRIADLEYYTKQGNIEVLENIANFTESMNPDKVPFEKYFAKQMGINLANMLNNGWSCNNFSHRQDYTLTGEMCDDSYDYVPDKIKQAEIKNKDDLGKMKALKSNYRLKFFLQTYVLSSNIKILEEEMNLRGKTLDKSLLDEFLDNFVGTLDLERVSLNLSNNSNVAKQAFELLVKTPKDIVNLLAYEPIKPEEEETKEQHYLRCLSKEVIFSHKGNNAFYDRVSQGIADRLQIQRSFVNETEKEREDINSFLENNNNDEQEFN